MAQINLPNPQIGKTDKETIQNLFDAFYMMRKQFEHFSQFIDSDNVYEINTNITKVRSDKGTTVIKGPLIEMSDRQAVPALRLQMGFDTLQNKFVFEIYDPDGKKSVYLDENGTEVLDGKLLITYLGAALLEAYKDTFGGSLKIYNNEHTLDASLGVQSGTSGNVGGTLILYINSPYDTSPDSDLYKRVEMGIYDGIGICNVRDNSAKARITIEADSVIGPYLGIRDVDEVLKSFLTQTSGCINGVNIATQAWAAEKGKNTESDTHTHTVDVGGVIYTTSAEIHSHTQK